jgi:hypothetical protein
MNSFDLPTENAEGRLKKGTGAGTAIPTQPIEFHGMQSKSPSVG